MQTKCGYRPLTPMAKGALTAAWTRPSTFLSTDPRGCCVSPSSWPPLLGPALSEPDLTVSRHPAQALRTPLQGDTVSIRKDVGDEPCRGTLEVAERGYLHS